MLFVVFVEKFFKMLKKLNFFLFIPHQKNIHFLRF